MAIAIVITGEETFWLAQPSTGHTKLMAAASISSVDDLVRTSTQIIVAVIASARRNERWRVLKAPSVRDAGDMHVKPCRIR